MEHHLVEHGRRMADSGQGEQATAIDKALEVLFHLHAQPEPQGVSEIGRALALPKSSAHRLLAALLRRDLVERDEAGRYRPGSGLLRLAVGVLEREPLVAFGRQVLEEEARVLGETFFLVGARAGRLIVLDKAEGTGLLRASPRVGAEVPVHATAVGKLYLAHAPELVSASRERPERFTRSTVISSTRLGREVDEARAQGYALNREEWIEGLTVFAAPVMGARGMLGGVCVALPSSHLPRLDERKVIRRVVEAAARIGARLHPHVHAAGGNAR